MKRSFIREILESIDEHTISFAGGLPDESLFPVGEFDEASRQVFTSASRMQYTTSNGIKELRELIAAKYTREGFPTSADEILITTGSQQAMYLIARYYAHRSITIEEPSYLGAMNIFRLNHMSMEGVPTHEEGIECDLFEHSVAQTKLAYLIPDFQNPSTSTYSRAIRDHVVAILQKHQAIVIEDAPYSDLYFEEKLPSLSQYLPDQSYHLGSFSKTLAPSLRLGWIRASREKIAQILPIKESVDLHTCTLSQYLVIEYMKIQGERYEERMDRVRAAYAAKAKFFCDLIDELLPSFLYQKPKGGMFVYGRFEGIDTKALVQEALKNKVVFVPGAEFYPTEVVSDEMRLNFTRASEEQMRQGLQILADLIDHARSAGQSV